MVPQFESIVQLEGPRDTSPFVCPLREHPPAVTVPAGNICRRLEKVGLGVNHMVPQRSFVHVNAAAEKFLGAEYTGRNGAK